MGEDKDRGMGKAVKVTKNQLQYSYVRSKEQKKGKIKRENSKNDR